MDIVSVQSRVVWGYVGNAVAVPTMQALGADARPVDTVRLAHHPGYGDKPWGVRTEPAEIAGLLTGALGRIDGPAALLMGYLGTAEQGRVVLQTQRAAIDDGRALPLYLDPAFGDEAEGVYVDPAIVAFLAADAVAAAHVLLPNRFELATLSGMAVATPADAVAAARSLMTQGPALVMVSSVPLDDGRIGNVLVSAKEAWLAAVPRRVLRAKGTGDMLSAAFTALHAAGHPSPDAFAVSVTLVNNVICATARRDLPDLHLQTVFEKPSTSANSIPIALIPKNMAK